MKEIEFETKHSHLRTFVDINPSCDHDYQFIVTLSAIRDGKGDFIFNELYQCCKCMKIGVLEQKRDNDTIRW